MTTTNLLPVSVDLLILDISHEWNHTCGGLLGLASLTVYHVRVIHSASLLFVAEYYSSVWIGHLYLSIHGWAFGLFQLWGCCESCYFGCPSTGFCVDMFSVVLHRQHGVMVIAFEELQNQFSWFGKCYSSGQLLRTVSSWTVFVLEAE